MELEKSLCAGATYCGDPAVPERLGPALLPFPGRGLLAPPSPQRRFSTQVCDEGSCPGPRPTTRHRPPPRAPLGAPTKPSWLLDPVSSKGGTAPQHLATPGALRVARGRSYSSLPTFRGDLPPPAVLPPLSSQTTPAALGPAGSQPFLFPHPWEETI